MTDTPIPTISDIADAAGETVEVLQQTIQRTGPHGRIALRLIHLNLLDLSVLARTLGTEVDATKRAQTLEEMDRRVKGLTANINAGINTLTTTSGISEAQHAGVLDAATKAQRTSELLATFITNTLAQQRRRKEDV